MGSILLLLATTALDGQVAEATPVDRPEFPPVVTAPSGETPLGLPTYSYLTPHPSRSWFRVGDTRTPWSRCRRRGGSPGVRASDR